MPRRVEGSPCWRNPALLFASHELPFININTEDRALQVISISNHLTARRFDVQEEPERYRSRSTVPWRRFPRFAGFPAMNGMSDCQVRDDMDAGSTLSDRLKAVEHNVVQGEWQLAQQESRLVKLKQQNFDISEVSSALRTMLEEQRRHQAERLRLLSLLEPQEPSHSNGVDSSLPVIRPQTPAGSKPQRLAASAHSAEAVSMVAVLPEG